MEKRHLSTLSNPFLCIYIYIYSHPQKKAWRQFLKNQKSLVHNFLATSDCLVFLIKSVAKMSVFLKKSSDCLLIVLIVLMFLCVLLGKNRVWNFWLFIFFWYLKGPKPYFYRVFCAPFLVHVFVFFLSIFQKPYFYRVFSYFLWYPYLFCFGQIFKNPIFTEFFSTSMILVVCLVWNASQSSFIQFRELAIFVLLPRVWVPSPPKTGPGCSERASAIFFWHL